MNWECQLTPDQFLFQEHMVPPSWVHPFTLQLEATYVSRGIALLNVHYTNTYVQYKTILGSSGTGPVTSTSWMGIGVQNPLLHALQVSHDFDLLGIYLIDIGKAEQAHPGQPCVISELPL